MEEYWPETDKSDALVALGDHWRTATRRLRMGTFRMRQFGHYYYQQCWRGVRLRFSIIREEPEYQGDGR
jgi:hypothetical protein